MCFLGCVIIIKMHVVHAPIIRELMSGADEGGEQQVNNEDEGYNFLLMFFVHQMFTNFRALGGTYRVVVGDIRDDDGMRSWSLVTEIIEQGGPWTTKMRIHYEEGLWGSPNPWNKPWTLIVNGDTPRSQFAFGFETSQGMLDFILGKFQEGTCVRANHWAALGNMPSKTEYMFIVKPRLESVCMTHVHFKEQSPA